MKEDIRCQKYCSSISNFPRDFCVVEKGHAHPDKLKMLKG
jgi:hypothetical protein